MEKIRLLKKLGMTEYEARSYLSLVNLGPSKVADIVKESKLPRNKTYEALQNLENKGYVVILPISPRKYKISDPNILKKDIEEMAYAMDELIDTMNSPKAEFNDIFWVINGRKPLLDRFTITNQNAKIEIFSISDLSDFKYDNIRTMKEAIGRGVKVRMITNFKKEGIVSYNKWIEIGAEIRVMEKDNIPRIAVIDKKIARLTIGIPEVKTEDDYITLWTESIAFAEMIRNQFQNLWKKCKPIEKYMD